MFLWSVIAITYSTLHRLNKELIVFRGNCGIISDVKNNTGKPHYEEYVNYVNYEYVMLLIVTVHLQAPVLTQSSWNEPF